MDPVGVFGLSDMRCNLSGCAHTILLKRLRQQYANLGDTSFAARQDSLFFAKKSIFFVTKLLSQASDMVVIGLA